MSIGFWVVAFAVLFIIGNLMAAKPKIHEVRLGKLRLLARQKGFNPKLVTMPEWIKNNQNLSQNQKTALITQYSVINDDWRSPLSYFIFHQNQWQNLQHDDVYLNANLPDKLSPYFVGLMIKANSLSLYWHDELYLKQFPVRQDIHQIMENDLNLLSDYLSSLLNSPK